MIRFSKFIWFYFLLSGFIIVPGIYSLLTWGLRPAIDFTGGTLLEVSLAKPLSNNTMSGLASSHGLALASIQQSGTATYLLRFKPEKDENVTAFQSALASASGNINVSRIETVGPVLGKELLTKAIGAAIVAIVAILLYIAYAFRNLRFGVAAIIALIHDLLVVLGSFSMLGHFYGVEVDTLFVTAVLTTMSFSVHDTIVVFDRIREYRHRDDRTPLDELSDRALTETMGRSLTNSLTIILMLLALVLMGGSSVKWFMVALLIGTTSGAYSSPFIATPILLLWDRLHSR